MPFCISRSLRLEIETFCSLQNLRHATDKEIAAILQLFERQGDAMRALNKRGDVIWKATPQLLEELAGMEREVRAEFKNEN